MDDVTITATFTLYGFTCIKFFNQLFIVYIVNLLFVGCWLSSLFSVSIGPGFNLQAYLCLPHQLYEPCMWDLSLKCYTDLMMTMPDHQRPAFDDHECQCQISL